MYSTDVSQALGRARGHSVARLQTIQKFSVNVKQSMFFYYQNLRSAFMLSQVYQCGLGAHWRYREKRIQARTGLHI